MEIMGAASVTIHEGLLRQNKHMVQQGVSYILNHPAPKHKPWIIMNESDQMDFKQSLISFDKILDIHARKVIEAANLHDWVEANAAASDLSNACIACHSMWKLKVK